ncbi:MAG TPA: ribonuclease HI family protein [Acidobacteriota bacterium]|nr:ribonuclease HI family protein [Acidobacteriota bacterium]
MIEIYIDGAARGNPGPAGYGIAAADADGTTVAEGYGFIGEQTNNFAEYCALLAALELAQKKGWRELMVRSDSQLLVRQIQGVYKVKNEGLRALHSRATLLIGRFRVFEIEHVSRSENKLADKLANKGVDEQKSKPRGINPILVKGR